MSHPCCDRSIGRQRTMTSDTNLVQQGRSAIDAVSKRVKSDPDYAARFKEEPVAVLLEAGAPAEGMGDILRETGFNDDDVAGFALTLGISSPTTLSGTSTLTGTTSLSGTSGLGTVRPGGGFAECSGTCNCSSSCLFTF